MRRLTHDEFYLAQVKLVAARSTCGRRAVGAIVVDKNHQVLSTGYNGVPRGFPHCIDTACAGRFDEKGDTRRCMAVHAEVNALLQCPSIDRAHTLYISCTPCFVCAKQICNTEIQRVVVIERYADSEGEKILIAKGVQVEVKGLDYDEDVRDLMRNIFD